MKKIYFVLLTILSFAATLRAQENAGDVTKMWSYPVVYNYDEQISWYFDLSGTTFAENEDIYLWIWSPSEPDAGNWENSSEFAKLTYTGNYVWRFDLTPTVYFSRTPEQIKASAGFWFRLKDKTGSKQSGVAQVPQTDFSAFATSGKMVDHYPKNFYLDQPFSILFNANMVPGFENPPSVHMHGGLNDFDEAALQQYQAWLPEITEKTQLVNMGNGIYRKDMIPRQYFNASETYVMHNVAFLFVVKDWAATSPNQVIYAPDVPAPKPAETYLLPQKVSAGDLLCIVRKNNEAGVSALTYVLTAGTREITGSFEGIRDDLRAYINLVAELQGLSGLTELHLLVKDNRERVVLETTIPLIQKN